MSKFQQLIGVLFVLVGAGVPAHAQSCNFGEAPSDFCSGARVIPGDPGHHVVLMDAHNATESNETVCGLSAGHTVWFEVTPTVSGPMTISTCHPNTLYDTVIEVYSGGESSCEFMKSVSCNDDTTTPECDNGCSFWGSNVTIIATAGVRYRFVVGSVDNDFTGCALCLGVIVTIGEPCGEPPRNFICPLARELPGTPGTHEVLIDATDMPSFPEDYSCGPNVGPNLWFRFNSAVNGLATFSTCHANTMFDTVARARVGDCTGLMAEVACADDTVDPACDNVCGDALGSVMSFPVSTGGEYFIEVGAFDDNWFECELCLGGTLTITDCAVVPAPVAEITAPTDLACACDTVFVEGTAETQDGFLDRYRLEYRAMNNPAWTTIEESVTPVGNDVLGVWDAAALGEGWYLLRLTVTSICGRASTSVRVVRLDRRFDNADLRSPASNAIVGGRVCPDGTAWDQCFDHYTVDFRPVGGGGFTHVDPGQTSYTTTVITDPLATWDTMGLAVPDGDYELRLRGFSACGHLGLETVTVTVDNTPPTAVITSPINCDYVDGVVSVVGSVNDANLANWVLQYTGGSTSGWVTIASGNTPVIDGVLDSWDTTGLIDCAYTLRLLVTDLAAVNCNGAIHHQSEYLVSVNVGSCLNFDADHDGDVDLDDFSVFMQAFTGP